ncbi:hypothetical protein J6590_096201 [Homalodisca vitripennis]|nr:hypothetical protein J6590_096201 [Homalodisca vitripennis]
MLSDYISLLNPPEVSYSLIENPLRCGCEQQELWEWLRDHQKLVGITKSGLRCEQPPELRGMLFLELEPPRFCSAPLVLKLDIQPFSVLVSWQSRIHSGLHGYRIAYHALDNLGPGGKDARAFWIVVRRKMRENIRGMSLPPLENHVLYYISIQRAFWIVVRRKMRENIREMSLPPLENHVLYYISIQRAFWIVVRRKMRENIREMSLPPLENHVLYYISIQRAFWMVVRRKMRENIQEMSLPPLENHVLYYNIHSREDLFVQ